MRTVAATTRGAAAGPPPLAAVAEAPDPVVRRRHRPRPPVLHRAWVMAAGRRGCLKRISGVGRWLRRSMSWMKREGGSASIVIVELCLASVSWFSFDVITYREIPMSAFGGSDERF